MNKRSLLIVFFSILFPLVILLNNSQFLSYDIFGKLKDYFSFSSHTKTSLIANEAIPIHHWKTKEETPVYFIPTEKLQMVDIIVTFDAGSARDGEKFGLAAFHTLMLEEGTENRSALQVAQAFENVGAIFDSNTERDKAVVQLRSLVEKDQLMPTIDLFAEIIAKPHFLESSIQQLKNQTLVTLKSESERPHIKAMTAFYQNSYGKHPYGHLILGNLDTVAKISRQDLIDFHKQYFVAKNAIITIVGGLQLEEAKEVSARITKDLSKGQIPPPLPEVPPLSEAINVHIAQTLQQTHVLLGQPCCTQNDPDYFSLLVGNYILGESPFVARLFKEIRDNRGLAYSISSNFRRLKQPGPFIVSLQTKSNQAKEAEKVVKDTLRDFIENGPSEEEVNAAKKGIMGGFPLAISNNAQIANVVSEMTFYDLPNNFLDTFRANIAKITREDVKTAFRRRLDPDKMVLVILGE